jgi:Mn-dependent DtxR family transcriptional regulator
VSAVGLGAYPPDYRSDGSFNVADERIIEAILFALEALHGEATTFALASHMQTTMRSIEPILARMRTAGLVKYEVPPNSTLAWRRTKAGIEMAKAVENRQRARRR